MGAPRPTQILIDVESEVRAVLEEAVVKTHVRRVRDTERESGDDAIRIGGRIPLAGVETDRGAQHRRERIPRSGHLLGGSNRIIVRLPPFVIAANSGGELA